MTELAVLTERVDNQNKTLERIEKKLDAVTGDHETRLRALEASDRKWAAAAIIVSAVLSLILKFWQ